MEVSDGGILKLYTKEPRRSLEMLYDRYKKYVYTIAVNYTGSREDALDITQEVFIKLFRNIDTLKDEFSLIPYVKRMTVNRCLNHIRDRKSAVSLNQTTDDGTELEEALPSRENTEQQFEYKDTKGMLQKAIQNLPADERMAIILRHVKGFRYEEIARFMDIPLGTVKTLLYRGRKKMKDQLMKQGIWEV